MAAERHEFPFVERIDQVVLVATFPAFCWLAMQAVHEAGHVVAAWGTGGTVTNVVLHPLAISRTGVSPNPHPLIVAWAGPIAGTLVPLALFLAMRALQIPGSYLARFFAGFCLIANGVYLGTYWIGGIGDAGDLLRYGAQPWQLVLFGLVAYPLGLFLWNGLGPKFGLGEAKGRVDRLAALTSVMLLFSVLALELLFTA